MKLTAKTIEAMRPTAARREIADSLLPGLYFIVQPSGLKSWAVRYRHGGKTRKHTLGPYPTLDLATARKLGSEALRKAATGTDPGEEKKEVASSTVEAVVAEFIAKHCQRRQRPRTLKENSRMLHKYVLPRWGKRSIATITRADVRAMLEKIVADTPVMANRCFEIVRSLFNWCVESEILPVSPMAGLKRPADKKSERDRMLDDSEIRLVMNAAKQLGGPFGGTVQLLLLSGQRRGEVCGMTWREIDTEKRLWSLPSERTKNGVAHSVPLSEQALQVIEQQPKLGEFVFSFDGTRPVSNFTKDRERLAALLPATMPSFTLHDLRRSAASGLARIGVPLPVTEKILNHVSGSFGGIVGIYQKHDYANEKRDALNAWAAHVGKLVRGIKRVA